VWFLLFSAYAGPCPDLASLRYYHYKQKNLFYLFPYFQYLSSTSQEDFLLNKIFPKEYTTSRQATLQAEEEAKKFCSNFR
jgi:hypothetical protein